MGDVVRETLNHVDEVVVIDDGSTDDTSGSALKAGATVLKLPVNHGYGAALQTGYIYAAEKKFDYLVQLDADGQHDPGEIPALLEPVTGGEYDLAIGSRFLGGGDWRGTPLRRAGMRFFSVLIERLAGQTITDPTSGLQAMNRDVIERLAGGAYPDDFPDADVLVMLMREKFKVCEVGVVMKPSPTGKSMHAGLMPIYYVAKMLLSIFVVMLRRTERIEP